MTKYNLAPPKDCKLYEVYISEDHLCSKKVKDIDPGKDVDLSLYYTEEELEEERLTVSDEISTWFAERSQANIDVWMRWPDGSNVPSFAFIDGKIAMAFKLKWG